MSRCIYDKFVVTLSDIDNCYVFENIININEYDHEIEFETIFPIDGVKRGWVGDLYYHLKGIPIDDESIEVSSVTCLKEVLCTRVKVCAEAGAPVVWTYCFSKD